MAEVAIVGEFDVSPKCIILPIESVNSRSSCHRKLLSLPKTMQIAEAVRAQLDATGGFALESRRTGIGRRQTLDNHHLVRLGILEPAALHSILPRICHQSDRAQKS